MEDGRSGAGILETILAQKRMELERAKLERPLSLLKRGIEEFKKCRPLAARIAAEEGPPHRIIAEIKRASPSRGVLRTDLEPRELAERYERAGAVGVSVLTDERFFGGSLSHLSDVKAHVKLPVLRKDFLIDPYQVFESRRAGADAVLLIVRSLEDGQLSTLLAEITELGMEALVEVHDERDLERALDTDCRMIGINNRNLQTFRVDLAATERLVARIPGHVVVISCSGIQRGEQMVGLEAMGVKGFLIGESLVTAADPEAKLRELVA